MVKTGKRTKLYQAEMSITSRPNDVKLLFEFISQGFVLQCWCNVSHVLQNGSTGKLLFNMVRLLYILCFIIQNTYFFAAFGWRPVFRIRKFRGLPDPDPLVRGTDPDPSTSKNNMKKLYLYSFVTSLWIFIFKEWCKCTFKKY